MTAALAGSAGSIVRQASSRWAAACFRLRRVERYVWPDTASFEVPSVFSKSMNRRAVKCAGALRRISPGRSWSVCTG